MRMQPLAATKQQTHSEQKVLATNPQRLKGACALDIDGVLSIGTLTAMIPEYKVPSSPNYYRNTDDKITEARLKTIIFPCIGEVGLALEIASKNNILCVLASQRVVIDAEDRDKYIENKREDVIAERSRVAKSEEARNKLMQDAKQLGVQAANDRIQSRQQLYAALNATYGEDRTFLRESDNNHIAQRYRQTMIDKYVALSADHPLQPITTEDRERFKTKLARLSNDKKSWPGECKQLGIATESAEELVIENNHLALRHPLTYYIDKNGKAAYIQALAIEYKLAEKDITFCDDDKGIIEDVNKECKCTTILVTHEINHQQATITYNKDYLYTMLLQIVPPEKILLGIREHKNNPRSRYHAISDTFYEEFLQHLSPEQRIAIRYRNYELDKLLSSQDGISADKVAHWKKIQKAIAEGKEKSIEEIGKLVQSGRWIGYESLASLTGHTDTFGKMLAESQRDFETLARQNSNITPQSEVKRDEHKN